MTGRGMAAPDRVLLVGIDRYSRPREPGGLTYPCLAGAVRDVRGMERFLYRLGVPPERIERLVAPQEEPLPPPECLPTYENLVAALKRLSVEAKPGEQVLVFYAGHGGRVTTAFPELKGEEGLDEVLVPWNISNPGARCLRDVELACLVRRMVDRGIYLTLVLDCCHAGSALRKDHESLAFRGLGFLGSRPHVLPSLAGSRKELLASWHRHVDPDVPAPSGWLPSPRGYVLLAACEEHEKALEYAFDGENREGVLSRALLEALEPRSHISYRHLYEQVLSNVHSAFTSQTPQLEGDEERYVFETVRESRQRGVTVLRIDPGGGRVLLRAGEAQGVRPGARFEVSSAGTPEGGPAPAGFPVEVIRSGSSLSWARAEEELPASGLLPGAQAYLTALSNPLRVRLLGPASATEAMAAVLERRTPGFAVLAGPEDEPDVQVASDAHAGIEIRDERGERLPHQGHFLSIDQPGWIEPLCERLLHLARYRAVQRICGPPDTALLSGKLRVLLLPLGTGEVRDGAQAPPSPGAEVPVRAGKSLDFELRNTSRQPLHLTALHLRPDWSIVQVYPAPALGRAGLPLEPGLPLRWSFHRCLWPEIEPGREEILIFATAGAAEFRWLQLPPLAPLVRAASGQPPEAALSSRLRVLEPEAVADRGWTMWRLRVACEQSSTLRVGTE